MGHAAVSQDQTLGALGTHVTAETPYLLFLGFSMVLGGIMSYFRGVFPKHGTRSQSSGDGLEELKSVRYLVSEKGPT